MAKYAKRTCKCCGVQLPANLMKTVSCDNPNVLVCSRRCKKEILSASNSGPKSFASDITVGKMIVFFLFWPIAVPVLVLTMAYKIITTLLK